MTKYEIELKLVDKRTKKERLVTRQEYATCVLDAVQMSLLNELSALTGEFETKVLHVGLPAEEIRAYEAKLADDLSELVAEIGKR